MTRSKGLTTEKIIIALFMVLPVLDSLNGILITRGLPSIGTIYKVGILGLLILFSLRDGLFSPGILVCSLLAGAYLALSIGLNVFLLKGDLITIDFPIKLLFNVMQFVLLLNCHRAGLLTGKGLDTIFNGSTWLMLIVILIPYALGLGNTIYSGGIGYKGFFYSNNELSVVLLILFCYSLYRTVMRLNIANLIQLGGITVCVLLLNTKSGMIACALGLVLFVIEYLRKPGAKYKGLLLLLIAVAGCVSINFIMDQISSFLERQSYLHDLYGGSILDTLVSGRTFFLEEAWADFTSSDHLFLRLLIGNGFCSDSLVEMDFIDLFFYLGLIGLLAVTAGLFYLFIKCVQNCKGDGTIARPFGFLLVVGFSFLAGHTLFMATSGCYFVLMLCYDLIYKPERE